ncbi:MAG TPA: F0F1 ATP synthase subunit A [Kiritimatiellia bacterium]|nr:F0F1 ATP synthase subunit A [Kiritimatiellia bacterium]HMO99675.1 F0F1 ATP synthase subunit A [Kiritimatiellia bacterium]HMP96151.1 F0F1 ATP synthase subunit A [Kiritimatiellia bacterium]
MATAEEIIEQEVNRSELVQDYIMSKIADAPYWKTPLGPVPLDALNLTRHGLMLLLASALLIWVFGFLYRKKDPVPRGFTNLLEVLVLFIRDQIAIANLGERDGRKLAPFFLTLFFFILFLNLMGLIPLFAGATSNVNVTAGLALITLSVMIGGAIMKNGFIGFLRAFIPHGVPWPVMIILVPIEFMGMFIKAFALTMRLFANMLAGSIVLYSIIGLVVVFGIAGAPSLLLAAGIYILKVFVAFLQAFVFTLLSALFIHQVHHPAH